MLKKPFIIAEIGNNHEGSFSMAQKLILKAAECGVDAVKFQTYDVSRFIHKNEKKSYNRLKKFQLSYEEFYKLSLFAKSKKLKFISTPLDLTSVEKIKKFVDYFKISSGDNNFEELISSVLKKNKKTIISTGLLNEQGIKNLIRFIKYKRFNLKKLSILHCVSDYPANNADLNLNFISKLKNQYKTIKIGYSDHSIGLEAIITAFFLGAEVIEKHFTLDNNFSSFRDHKLSLDPINMKKFVEFTEKSILSFGLKSKRLSKNEIKNINKMRRSYYFIKDKNKGEFVNKNDILCLRPKLVKKKKLSLNSRLAKNYLKGQFFS